MPKRAHNLNKQSASKQAVLYYSSADQKTFSIYWFLINCQSVIIH